MKIDRLFLLALAIFCRASLAMDAQAALQLLYGSGDSIHYDSAGYSYRIFNVEDSSGLQQLFDTITSRLLQTSIGKALCRDVLEANADALMHHLALSKSSAEVAAKNCSTSIEKSWMVYDSPHLKPRKLTLAGKNSPRRYVLIVTDRPDLPLDSWTDAFSNQTTLFLHNSRYYSDLSLRHLTQVLAHEAAIYFDSKSWPNGPGWKDIAQLKESRIKAKHLDLALNATLNPTLSTVLAYIRAYKVERIMLREISSKGLLGLDPVLYDTRELPFLGFPCRTDCVANFIEEQTGWIQMFLPALLALSPHYRAQRLDILRSRSANLDESVVNALERYPFYFFDQLQNDMLALNLITRPQSETEKSMHKAISKTMQQLLDLDLEALREAQIWVPEDKKNYDLLSYLTIPLLSDANISLAAGPRPRIRTGGTR